MRVLTRQEKIEFFLVAPVLFCLWLALFIYSVWQESVNGGYLIACLMIGLGSSFSIVRNGSSFVNLLISSVGILLTQFAFFEIYDLLDNYSIVMLQYISIYLLSLTAVINIFWLIKGKSVQSRMRTTI